ncbi:hypothetical protein V8E36_003197 [Tilletia maclaganii]
MQLFNAPPGREAPTSHHIGMPDASPLPLTLAPQRSHPSARAKRQAVRSLSPSLARIGRGNSALQQRANLPGPSPPLAPTRAYRDHRRHSETQGMRIHRCRGRTALRSILSAPSAGLRLLAGRASSSITARTPKHQRAPSESITSMHAETRASGLVAPWASSSTPGQSRFTAFDGPSGFRRRTRVDDQYGLLRRGGRATRQRHHPQATAKPPPGNAAGVGSLAHLPPIYQQTLDVSSSEHALGAFPHQHRCRCRRRVQPHPIIRASTAPTSDTRHTLPAPHQCHTNSNGRLLGRHARLKPAAASTPTSSAHAMDGSRSKSAE